MDKSTLEHLESKGVESVLLEMAQGRHGQPDSAMRNEVESWLRAKEHARQELIASRIEAAASSQRLWAMWATYAAIAAAIAAAIVTTIEVIKFLH